MTDDEFNRYLTQYIGVIDSQLSANIPYAKEAYRNIIRVWKTDDNGAILKMAENYIGIVGLCAALKIDDKTMTDSYIKSLEILAQCTSPDEYRQKGTAVQKELYKNARNGK